MALTSEGFSTSSSSLRAPTKLDPQSEHRRMTGPHSARNLRRVFIKLEVSMALMTSMWIAHIVMHMNSTAQCLA